MSLASAKSGMDEKTARKYRCLGKLPSVGEQEAQLARRVKIRSRRSWEEVRSKLDVNSGLQAKTLFKDLQRRHPEPVSGRLQRSANAPAFGMKQWRALEGPPKEVFFEQRHEPWRVVSIGFHEHE